MAIIQKQQRERGKRVIDLTSPQGNVFFLIGTAKTWGKQLGLDVETIVTEMMSGDYENAIRVFDENFGMICDLER